MKSSACAWAAGERPDLDAFCNRFPTLRLSLRKILVGHLRVARDKDALENAPPVFWPEAGERFGDWTVLRELGRGAFARVYLALEESTGGRPVAVKFSPEGAAEAWTMGRLVHPNIVPVLSVRFEESVGLTAVCMPYLGAATLTDVMDLAYPTADAPPPREAAVIGAAIHSAACSDDPLPLSAGAVAPRPYAPESGFFADAVARIALQIADALAFLHKEGVVHLDLKPSNVLLRTDGQALLLDFNLSADARAAGPRLGGTLPYMAPEQLRAFLSKESGDVGDGRLDLFALGVMLYELLTGRHPFGAPPAGQPTDEAAQTLLERQQKGCASVRSLNSSVDRDFARLIASCLALEPSDRPASAAVLATGLRRCFALPAQLRRWAARRPLIAAAAAGLLLLAAGGAASDLAAPQPPADVREYNRGRAAYLDGDYAAAEELFKQAVQDCASDPKPRKYYLARAAGAMRLAEAADDNLKAAPLLHDAILDLAEAEEQHPDGATLALLGYCNSRVGNNEIAVQWYDRAVQAGFTSAGLYNDRGVSRMQSRLLESAGRDFALALQSDPQLQSAIINRVLVMLQQRNVADPPPLTDSMLADIKQVVEMDAGSQELYFSAARVFAVAAKEGRPGEPKGLASLALFCLQKAVACGADPKIIGKSHTISDALKDVPEYQTLMEAPPGPAGPKPRLRLVDPAPYLPE